jgi:hypothetical protein
MNMSPVATFIARMMSCCIGVALLIIFVALHIWKTASLESWAMFGAMIGLCLGYGLGGDILGARLFDFFARQKTERFVGQPVPRLSKTLFFMLVGVLGVLLALFIRVLIYSRHHDAS